MLEEIRLVYNLIYCDLFLADHLTEGYRSIAPIQRTLAIADRAGHGGVLPVFESGAILLYLAEKLGGDLGLSRARNRKQHYG
jgi:GST-like protein